MKTFLLACRVRIFHIMQFFRNVLLYYLWNPKFFLVDMSTLLQYFWKSPFKILHDYNGAPYGETDFYTFEYILNEFDIAPHESFLEIGSGRARLCLWLALVRKQKIVYGIEECPIIAERAQHIIDKYCVSSVKIWQGNWKDMHIPIIDTVYIYVAAQNEHEIQDIAQHLSALSVGTKIITIGWHCAQYFPDRFFTKAEIPVQFEWGKTMGYLQTIQ